jgi:hypothetical protein
VYGSNWFGEVCDIVAVVAMVVAVAVVAMVDRLIHHSHVFKGDSYGLKDKQQEVTATEETT